MKGGMLDVRTIHIYLSMSFVQKEMQVRRGALGGAYDVHQRNSMHTKET